MSTGVQGARQVPQPWDFVPPLLCCPVLQGHYSEADARSIFLQIIRAIQSLHSKWVPPREPLSPSQPRSLSPQP